MKECDEILEKTLKVVDLMVELADQGDAAREDVGCGVLYGFLRDSAFKIRKMAEEEIKAHARKAAASAHRQARKETARG